MSELLSDEALAGIDEAVRTSDGQSDWGHGTVVLLLDHIDAQAKKINNQNELLAAYSAHRAVMLVNEWLCNNSGYHEATWPVIAKAIVESESTADA